MPGIRGRKTARLTVVPTNRTFAIDGSDPGVSNASTFRQTNPCGLVIVLVEDAVVQLRREPCHDLGAPADGLFQDDPLTIP